MPGIEAPPAVGATMMALAGIGWRVYSIRGRLETNALVSTCSNFVYSIAFVVVLTGMPISSADITNHGVVLTFISGALTSGVVYVIWYAALNYFSNMQAALVQLSVPVIAPAGGVILLAEPVSLRLLTSGMLILGGISMALVQKFHRATDS